MKFRVIQEREKDRFNEFIAKHVKGHILQSFNWGLVKKGWQAVPCILEKEGKIIAASLLLKRKLPFINKTFFYAPRGPVLDIHDYEVFDFFLSKIRELAFEHRAIFLKIDPDIEVADEKLVAYLKKREFKTLTKGKGFQGVQPRSVFRLDITPTEEELFNNFKPKTRYNIRYAIKKGVEIREGSFEDLEIFYNILVETAERDNFKIRSYEYYVDMWMALHPEGYLKLFLAEAPTAEGKRVIAGTLAFLFGDKAWYIYGASSNNYRNLMPNYLLQWSMIIWAKEEGCSLYDFRGVPSDISEDNPLYGLYRFKVGFSGQFTTFVGEYDLVFSKFWYSIWQLATNYGLPLIKKVRKGIKKLKG